MRRGERGREGVRRCVDRECVASRYSPWAINVLANSDVREKGGDWGCR